MIDLVKLRDEAFALRERVWSEPPPSAAKVEAARAVVRAAGISDKDLRAVLETIVALLADGQEVTTEVQGGLNCFAVAHAVLTIAKRQRVVDEVARLQALAAVAAAQETSRGPAL